MALSNSNDFVVNRTELIQSSLRVLGEGKRGSSISNEEMEDAVSALSMMLKAWQMWGLQLWTKRSASLTLVASQASYTLGTGGDLVIDRPLQILSIQRKITSDSTEVTLEKVSHDTYLNTSNKSTIGVPNQYYYDPKWTISDIADKGKLYVWPTADATTAAAQTLEITYQKPFDDVDSSSDDIEIPQEGYEAAKYGLAYRLAPEYGVSPVERSQLRKDADKALEEFKAWDQEDSSIFFTPSDRTGSFR